MSWAARSLRRRISALSHSPDPAAPQQLVPLLTLATQWLSAGRPADAIAPLSEAARLQPSNDMIQHDLGLACLEAGRLPNAIAALQRAIAINPRYTDAYFRLGIAMEKTGDSAGAIAAYGRATRLFPSLTEAWFRCGALFYTSGDRDKAIHCFRNAETAGGNSSFGLLGEARALLTEDRSQEAEQVLRNMLAVDPANAMAHELLGNLLSEFGRFGEARECFERALGIAPLLAGSYYDLVRCRPVTRVCCNGWKLPWPRLGWNRGSGCAFISRLARQQTIWVNTHWPCSISMLRMPFAAGRHASIRLRFPKKWIA